MVVLVSAAQNKYSAKGKKYIDEKKVSYKPLLPLYIDFLVSMQLNNVQ